MSTACGSISRNPSVYWELPEILRVNPAVFNDSSIYNLLPQELKVNPEMTRISK